MRADPGGARVGRGDRQGCVSSRHFFLHLLLAVLVSCTGRCACDPVVDAPERPATGDVGPLRWAVSGGRAEPLQLVGNLGRLTAGEASGSVLWVARGPRDRWLHHLELSLDVNRLEPGISSLNLTTSRCRVRYLEEGRETEADYSVSKSRIESLAFAGEQWTADIDVTCAKIVPTRSDGRAYAAPLPDEIRVQGTAWAR